MSMTPIVQTYDGRSYTFSLTLAVLNTVLTADALNEAFRPNAFAAAEAYHQFRGPGPCYPPGMVASPPTASIWANTLLASSPAAMSQIPPKQVIAVIAAALTGGGLTSEQRADVAERIHRNQNSRDVDFLAGAIVLAAIAAG